MPPFDVIAAFPPRALPHQARLRLATVSRAQGSNADITNWN